VHATNTAIIVAFVMIGTLFSASFAAYGFSRLQAPGRDAIFMVLLGTMMLPGAVTLVPTYLLFNSIGWVNTFMPLIVPAFFGNAFFVFLMRQFYITIPKELEESAMMDGATVYHIWWFIMLPLSGPILAHDCRGIDVLSGISTDWATNAPDDGGGHIVDHSAGVVVCICPALFCARDRDDWYQGVTTLVHRWFALYEGVCNG
jgi:ABC-type sugar transport system permease subunit